MWLAAWAVAMVALGLACYKMLNGPKDGTARLLAAGAVVAVLLAWAYDMLRPDNLLSA